MDHVECKATHHPTLMIIPSSYAAPDARPCILFIMKLICGLPQNLRDPRYDFKRKDN